MKQYMSAVSTSEEDVNYVGYNNYRGPNQYQARAPTPTPYVPPNRNPMYNQELPPTEHYLKTVLQDINVQLHGVRGNLKGINTHLHDIDGKIGEFDVWRRSVDTQLGNLAQQMPRPQGQLPGHPDENPKGHIAAISLRSGKELPGRRAEEEKAREKESTPLSSQPSPVSARYGADKTLLKPQMPNIEPNEGISARYAPD